jgi:integrase
MINERVLTFPKTCRQNFFRNFDLERPKQKRLVPQWDIGLVLSALKLPQFEPAIEVVSYKCCFLLVLASGRRRSEIHALSVSDFFVLGSF